MSAGALSHFAPGDARRLLVHPFAERDVNWLLDFRAETRRDHPFLIWEPFEGERQVWTYGEFRARVLRVAAGLRRRGIGDGDTLLVHLDNSPEMEFLWFACSRLGAVVVTTNTRSAGDELAYFVDHCGAKAAITQPELAETLAKAGPRLSWLAVTEHLVEGGVPPAGLAPDRGSAFSSIDADPAGLPKLAPDPWRTGSVQYTSGTTSRPKGVLWTQGNALWGARTSAIHQNLNANDVHHVVMPSFHTNARTYSILPTLWVGGTVVLQPKFSARRYWDVALRNRCSWASTLPFFAKALMPYEVPKHHFRMWGAAINDPPFAKHFGVPTIGWWGMTETVSQGIIGDVHVANTPMSVGRPAAGYGIRVLRDDLATPVRPGEIGHLQCWGWRGIQMFSEYLGNAQATRDSFTADGWFVTGDRVSFDADGMITFADRDKDMLKVGAENVAASEIERVIMLVAGVHECAVVAQKHRMLDEVPVAFVIPAPGLAPAARAELPACIRAECAAKLADFKRPREVFVVDEMPRSTLEKIHKAELRKRLPVAG